LKNVSDLSYKNPLDISKGIPYSEAGPTGRAGKINSYPSFINILRIVVVPVYGAASQGKHQIIEPK